MIQISDLQEAPDLTPFRASMMSSSGDSPARKSLSKQRPAWRSGEIPLLRGRVFRTGLGAILRARATDHELILSCFFGENAYEKHEIELETIQNPLKSSLKP